MTEQPTYKPEATLLTINQSYGEGALDVIKKFGVTAGLSDFAIALGGWVSDDPGSKTKDGQHAGLLWSASSDGNGYVRAVTSYGDRNCYNPNIRFLGARPALPSSVTSQIEASVASLPRKKIQFGNDEVEMVEYGEYPQTAVDADTAAKLTDALNAENLRSTGATYKVGDRKFDEYEYNNERYVRVEAKPYIVIPNNYWTHQ